MGTTRILTGGDIASIIGQVGLDAVIDDLIDRLGAAFAADDPLVIDTIPRTGFHYAKPDHGLVEWMPAIETGRRVSLKVVGYHPTNPVERGAPSVLATTSLYDTADGRLLLLCDATFLTALRTGCSSAIVTDILAAPRSATLGIVGCGAQAVTQIHAISRVRTLDRVLAFDADRDVSATLADRLARARVDVPVTIVTAPADVVSASDILCTATSVEVGAGPVIPDEGHRPGLHVNAVGADHPGKFEIPASMLARAVVVPDVVEQCLVEGESQQLDREALGPSLPELVRNRHRYEALRPSLTVFDSTGWSLADLIAAEAMFEHAERLDVGDELDLQPALRDPYDPYELLWR